MKKSRFSKVIFCAILVLACAFANVQVLAEASVHRVEPLPPTLDIENLSPTLDIENLSPTPDIENLSPTPGIENLPDCMFPASFSSLDVYLNDDGALVIHMLVYDNELFDLVEIANLAVGDIIVIDGEEQTVASITTDEYGCRLINGGYEEDGWTLATDESGVYYAIDVNDMLHYRALGEVILPVDQEFTMEDSSDLENPEKVLYAGDLLTDVAPYEMVFFAQNTTVTVEDGFITNIKVVYVP